MNRRPTDYKSVALPAELHQQTFSKRSLTFWAGKYIKRVKKSQQKYPALTINTMTSRGSKALSFIFVLPWIIIFTIFWLYPIGYSFYLSFTNFSLISPETIQWLGVGNYKQLLSDPVFLLSMKNTLIFCVGTIPLAIILAILIGNAIHHSVALQAFFRTSAFLLSVISVTVTSLIFIQLYSRDGYLCFLGGWSVRSSRTKEFY